jgi:hypothetical protein
MNRLLSLLFLVFVSTIVAQAQQPAPSGSPAPDGYLITPFGYFHPSCFKQLADGDVLKDDGIQHGNGNVDSIEACAYPHYTGDGEEVAPGAKDPKIKHDWIVDETTTTGSSFGALTSEWTVPPGPKTTHGQTIFFFPGMQDTSDVKTIIQPVLGWNSDYADAWGIASWNCCVKGIVAESSPRHVKTGDTILGEIFDTCKAGTLECHTWDILTDDLTSGKWTELIKTSNDGQTFNWAFTSALEVYNIVDCSDYPAGGHMKADDIHLYNDKFDSITLTSKSWFTQIATTVSPQCNYNAIATDGFKDITLTY